MNYDSLFDTVEIAFKKEHVHLPFALLRDRLRPNYENNVSSTTPEEFAKIIVDFYQFSLENYNFETQITKLLQKGNIFFTEVSRWVRKINDPSIGTAGIGYDKHSDEFVMFYNPGFMALLTSEEHNGIIMHELCHLIFKHITSRLKTPHVVSNIAQDEAINSLIAKEGVKLPSCGVMPGVRPKEPVGGFTSKEAKLAYEAYADVIEGSPLLESSEYYFELLMKMNQRGGGNYGWNENGLFSRGANGEEKVEIDQMDNHNLWDTVPEELRGLVEGKRKNIIEKAVKRADNQSNGWGNIPEAIREEIRASISDVVDWKTLLERFPGQHLRGKSHPSKKKINKRYPYIFSGQAKSYLPLVLVAVDQSGSVDNLQLEEIFGVLGNLSRRTTFHTVNFDTEIDKSSFQVWKRGTHPVIKRTRCGGTNFDCVQEWVESQNNKNNYQCMIICTDGECSKPPPSKIPRAWVITRGNKLMFEPDAKDIVIYMDKNVSTGGLNDKVR